MKTRFKHQIFAAVPYWIVQVVVLYSGYIDGDVILRIFLPIFVAAAALLLMSQFWAGHGVWLAPTAGLLVEWMMRGSGSGRTNTVGILANLAISLLGYLLCGVIQTIVNRRKAKAKEVRE